MMWWEWAVDIFFYCDILITFFTGEHRPRTVPYAVCGAWHAGREGARRVRGKEKIAFLRSSQPRAFCARAGYEQGMVLVTSKKKIAMKYLSGWFLIDAVARPPPKNRSYQY